MDNFETPVISGYFDFRLLKDPRIQYSNKFELFSKYIKAIILSFDSKTITLHLNEVIELDKFDVFHLFGTSTFDFEYNLNTFANGELVNQKIIQFKKCKYISDLYEYNDITNNDTREYTVTLEFESFTF